MSRTSLSATEEVSDSITLHREYLFDKFGRLKLGTPETGLLSASQTLGLGCFGCAAGTAFGDDGVGAGRAFKVV
jgi:hypothetical protein